MAETRTIANSENTPQYLPIEIDCAAAFMEA